jgi:peptide/nickel transport system substrate-binding protein
VDFIWSVPAATAATLNDNSNIVVNQYPSNRVNFISMNIEKAPFNNIKLRQALNYAIDRDSIGEIVYEGNSVSKDYMAFPWMSGFREPVVRYDYNPEKAAALAEEAGVSREHPITVPFIITTSSQKIGETLQPYFAEIGINIILDLMEFNSWITDYYSGNFQIGAGGFYMVYKDMNLISAFYRTESIDINNSSRYSNKEADDLFYKGRREVNSAARTEYYGKAMDIVQAEAPYIMYANPLIIRAYNKDIAIAHYYANGIFIRDISWL